MTSHFRSPVSQFTRYALKNQRIASLKILTCRKQQLPHLSMRQLRDFIYLFFQRSKALLNLIEHIGVFGKLCLLLGELGLGSLVYEVRVGEHAVNTL